MANNPIPPNPNTVHTSAVPPQPSKYQAPRHTWLGWSLAALVGVVVISFVAMRDDSAVVNTQPSPPASTLPAVPSPDTTPVPSTPDTSPLPDTAPTSPMSPDVPITPRTDGGGEPL